MEYIGTKNQAAPLLKDIKLEDPEEIMNTLYTYMKNMYQKAKLVHGDFSVFNVLYHRKRPYIIDFGQGVLLEHPNSDEFLRRDIINIKNILISSA